jgi:hypothetical protein
MGMGSTSAVVNDLACDFDAHRPSTNHGYVRGFGQSRFVSAYVTLDKRRTDRG